MSGTELLRKVALLLARAMYLGMEQLYQTGEADAEEPEIWEEQGINAALQTEPPVPAETAVGAPDDGTAEPEEGDRLAEELSGLTEQTAGIGPMPVLESGSELRGRRWLSFEEAESPKATAEFPGKQSVSADDGRAMERISSFFERDARRYDGGFEEGEL